jgi:hypothetical protein
MKMSSSALDHRGGWIGMSAEVPPNLYRGGQGGRNSRLDRFVQAPSLEAWRTGWPTASPGHSLAKQVSVESH